MDEVLQEAGLGDPTDEEWIRRLPPNPFCISGRTLLIAGCVGASIGTTLVLLSVYEYIPSIYIFFGGFIIFVSAFVSVMLHLMVQIDPGCYRGSEEDLRFLDYVAQRYPAHLTNPTEPASEPTTSSELAPTSTELSTSPEVVSITSAGVEKEADENARDPIKQKDVDVTRANPQVVEAETHERLDHEAISSAKTIEVLSPGIAETGASESAINKGIVLKVDSKYYTTFQEQKSAYSAKTTEMNLPSSIDEQIELKSATQEPEKFGSEAKPFHEQKAVCSTKSTEREIPSSSKEQSDSKSAPEEGMSRNLDSETGKSFQEHKAAFSTESMQEDLPKSTEEQSALKFSPEKELQHKLKLKMDKSFEEHKASSSTEGTDVPSSTNEQSATETKVPHKLDSEKENLFQEQKADSSAKSTEKEKCSETQSALKSATKGRIPDKLECMMEKSFQQQTSTCFGEIAEEEIPSNTDQQRSSKSATEGRVFHKLGFETEKSFQEQESVCSAESTEKEMCSTGEEHSPLKSATEGGVLKKLVIETDKSFEEQKAEFYDKMRGQDVPSSTEERSALKSIKKDIPQQTDSETDDRFQEQEAIDSAQSEQSTQWQ